MTNQTTEPTFTILGLARGGSWATLDRDITGLATALLQAQAWRDAVVDLPVIVRGVDGIVWQDGDVRVGKFVRIRNFDVTYEGIVRSADRGGIALENYSAYYEDTDGPYVAPEGDGVVLMLDEDATVAVAA